mmetsp:Transcript_16264/g.24104  ORF Transcript_16264/g.24104 Transcript_16264/m.24104 type:complete len:92 (+) Transcript_16264:166-441(+)
MVANFHKYQRKVYIENFKNNTCSHICSDYYKMFGRKRYISPKELKRIQKKIIDGGGRGIGRRDVRRIVQEYELHLLILLKERCLMIILPIN